MERIFQSEKLKKKTSESLEYKHIEVGAWRAQSGEDNVIRLSKFQYSFKILHGK